MLIAQASNHLPNNALAEALAGFVPQKKFEKTQTPPVAKLTIVPVTEPTPQTEAASLPDVVDIVDVDPLMTSEPAPCVKVAPSVPVSRNTAPAKAPSVQKGNVSVWAIVGNPQKLVTHVTALLQKKEDPLLVMNIKEGNVETSLTLLLLLIDGGTTVKFKVSDGKGRLLSLFQKNTVFYGGEFTGLTPVVPARQQIVSSFMNEMHVLMHQLFIAERNKAKSVISTGK